MSYHNHSHYDQFWDLCCDHGLLGMKLFKNTNFEKIHLLDQVPKILDVLEKKYAKFNDGRIEFRMQDAKTIKLDLDKKHYLVIAGVGGETLIEIIEAIVKNNPKANMDFALSPNSHAYEVRKHLQNNFTLQKEDLLKEANRFHEHLFVRYTPNCQSNISLTGGDFWQHSPIASAYLKKLIKHYGLINQHRDHPVSKEALDAYLALTLAL